MDLRYENTACNLAVPIKQKQNSTCCNHHDQVIKPVERWPEVSVIGNNQKMKIDIIFFAKASLFTA